MVTVQQVAQVLQPVFLTGILVHRRVRLVVFLQFVGADPHDALNGVERDGVEVFTGGYHQRAVDRDCEW